MLLYGVDLSNNNGPVNLQTVRRAGAVFAFLKATEGTYYRDSYFPGWWQQAAALGLVRGAYHFLTPWIDGRAQAEFLHEYVRTHGHFVRGDFVGLDLEWITGPDGTYDLNRVISCAEAFVRYARPQIDKQIVIYSSAGFWADLGNPESTLLTKFPLWGAEWNGTPGQASRFGGWSNVSFHQYNGSGSWPGVSGQCDLDSYLGDRKSLDKLRHNPPHF